MHFRLWSGGVVNAADAVKFFGGNREDRADRERRVEVWWGRRVTMSNDV